MDCESECFSNEEVAHALLWGLQVSPTLSPLLDVSLLCPFNSATVQPALPASPSSTVVAFEASGRLPPAKQHGA